MRGEDQQSGANDQLAGNPLKCGQDGALACGPIDCAVRGASLVAMTRRAGGPGFGLGNLGLFGRLE
jgi:hypothetical protein